MKKDIKSSGKKIFCSVLSVSSVAICLLLFFYCGVFASDDSGTFRGKWWNYYDRGVTAADSSGFENATKDLKKALSLRSKDQRMARTYGMHFIDYFPHRELGIIYLNQGKVAEAIKELEKSIRNEESAKAVHYLNKARKALLEKKQAKVVPPAIDIVFPEQNKTVNDLSVRVKGVVSGKGLVSGITVNGNPVRFEMAEEQITFEQEVFIEDGDNTIVVIAKDLMGNVSEKTISVIADREGPSISISGVRSEEKDGKRYVRITGEISDATGIDKVLVNGKEIRDSAQQSAFSSQHIKDSNQLSALSTQHAEGTVPDLRTKRSEGVESGLSPALAAKDKSHMFDISLERKASKKITMLCYDTLGNETGAEFDTEKELTAFNGNKRYTLLAFNGGKLFSSDSEPPVLSIKDSGDALEVFTDRFFIDGEAHDNKKVSRILVNGRDISAGKGKKVFFSKMLRLNEGKNRIVVDVYDSSDNKTTAEFTVKRKVPSVMQTGSRTSISILPFDNREKSTDKLAQLAYEHLIGSFVGQKRFSIIERAKLEHVLLEQKLTKHKLTDPENSIRIGRLMSADLILSTSIKEDGRSIEIISRAINTATSEIMVVKDVFAEDKSPAMVRELMEGLASKIARSFPVAEGTVIKSDRNVIVTDLGSSAKVKKNTGVIIYRKGKEIKHPVTGKSLGHDTIKLGEGNIEEIHEGFSKVKLSDRSKGHEIQVRDMIITK